MYSQAIVSMSLGNCREKDHSENHGALVRKGSRRRFFVLLHHLGSLKLYKFLNRLLWFAPLAILGPFFNHITSFANIPSSK